MIAIIGLPSVMPYRNPIIVAILLHVFIAGLFFLQIMHWQKAVGNKPIIMSYIVDPAPLIQSTVQAIQVSAHQRRVNVMPAKAGMTKLFLHGNHERIPLQNIKKPQHTKTIKRYSSDKKNGDYNALLLYLHNAIAEQQSYPADAALFGYQGTVQLQFIAYPDGHLQALKIITSSGHASLDKAGLQAINNTTSLAKLKEYISQPETLSIKLVYQRKSVI